MLSDYVLAKSLDEALEALRGGNARVVAGGTDLWLDLKSGKVSVDTLVSISGISELKEISMCDGRIRIGAAV
ncbi:MAG: FAD binding domain-containing protein, partial [Clostridia bacterium]|nr:FAD binding domain-containing protein [Clostridia bacterium]